MPDDEAAHIKSLKTALSHLKKLNGAHYQNNPAFWKGHGHLLPPGMSESGPLGAPADSAKPAKAKSKGRSSFDAALENGRLWRLGQQRPPLRSNGTPDEVREGRRKLYSLRGQYETPAGIRPRPR